MSAVLLSFIAPRKWALPFLFVCIMSTDFDGIAAESKPAGTKAKFKVSGYGLFGNRELRRLIRSLEIGGKSPEFFTPAFVEDASMTLWARLRSDGFLRPQIRIDLELANGKVIEVAAADLTSDPLPSELQIKKAHFRVYEGVLYHFESLGFQGLMAVSPASARSYFYETDALFKTKGARVFTPDRLRRGMASLTEVLDREGYRDARVEATSLATNHVTGAVRAVLTVQEGARYRVRSLREEVFRSNDTNASPSIIRVHNVSAPYSTRWREQTALSAQTNEFGLGYADATAKVTELAYDPGRDWVEVDVLATIHSGPRVRINDVRFEGEQRTSESLMRRRARVERGELLNPLNIDRGRNRLAQLGVFRRVNARMDPVDKVVSEPVPKAAADTPDVSQPSETLFRDVIFTVEEGRLFDVNLLAGYGSYEQLRGGVELELLNLWGLAHNARLKGVQSFKSTSGEFLYSIPQVLGKDIDLFFNANGLVREEVSFTREEFGGGLGVHRFVRALWSDVSLRYNYQVLNAANIFPAVQSEGLTNPAVGSVTLDLRHDRRNNPLYPRYGYKIFASFETAAPQLGGDASYERIDVSPSIHLGLGGGRYLSFGVQHGVAISFGPVSENLPFNRRYFPGGDNSIRGYPEGEASPRNAQGDFVGAETISLATVEFEQALTRSWSIVLFSDSLGYARRLDAYPWDTGLFSVGGGIRWRTLVGPVRAEYGHNLNPREGDPSGTFHISIGFPF